MECRERRIRQKTGFLENNSQPDTFPFHIFDRPSFNTVEIRYLFLTFKLQEFSVTDLEGRFHKAINAELPCLWVKSRRLLDASYPETVYCLYSNFFKKAKACNYNSQENAKIYQEFPAADKL